MDDLLLIRLSSLGDIVHALPAFAALRRARPAARIAWLVEPAGAPLLGLVPGLDEIIVRGRPGWFARLRERRRTAVDFQGLLKSGVLAAASRASRRIGFSGNNLRERGAALFYTDRLPSFAEDGHVIAKNLRLAAAAGAAGAGDAFEFPLHLPDELLKRVWDRLAAAGCRPGEQIVVCNVGAAWPTKRWMAGGWTRMLPGLRRPGVFPLLLWGTAAERAVATFAGANTGAAVAPFLSVPEVLALLRLSDLVISGDTFALQAACALGVRVLGLFGPTSPRRNGPFDPRDRAIEAPRDCRPCHKRACGLADCLSAIEPSDVLAAALEMLESGRG